RERGVGVDDHAVAGDDGAGRLETVHLLDLDKAHAATGEGREVVVVAEVRDVNAVLDRGVQYGFARWDGACDAVDGDGDHTGLGFRVGGGVKARDGRRGGCRGRGGRGRR